MKLLRLSIGVTKYERDWIRHAAKLKQVSLDEYVKRAINASLRREGVDAVLLPEREQRLRQRFDGKATR